MKNQINLKKTKGNVLIISSIFMAITLVILLLVVAIFMSHVNSVLYNFKLDVYSIAKSAIISVNKNKANTGNFSYNEKAYQTELEKVLKANYDLDEDMMNTEKLITKVVVKEFQVYHKGQKDAYTNERCNDIVSHIVLSVKIKPIILRSFLEKIFTFEIHEDVNMNLLNM